MVVKMRIGDALTCTCKFHKKVQSPRPTCVHLYFSDDNWAQICEECWDKLDKEVRKLFKEHKNGWDKTLCNLMEKTWK